MSDATDYGPYSGLVRELEVCISFCERSNVWDMQITQFVDGWNRQGARRLRTEDRSDMAMMVRALRDANKGKPSAQQELPEAVE